MTKEIDKMQVYIGLLNRRPKTIKAFMDRVKVTSEQDLLEMLIDGYWVHVRNCDSN